LESVSSQNWISPATAPSTRIVMRVESGSSHGKSSGATSHQRKTSGVAMMRRSSASSSLDSAVKITPGRSQRSAGSIGRLSLACAAPVQASHKLAR
jgi:hypothetical protein